MRDILTGGGNGGERTPEAAAQENMRPVLPKRFYKTVSIAPQHDAYAVLLDGKSVRTPAKATLSLPGEAAARLVAGEWEAQGEHIDPAAMPVTRLVNTALDGIAGDTQPVLEDIVRFAASDLLFYRASYPEALVESQKQHWDPILDWVGTRTGARFECVEGVMHIDQSREALALFSAHLKPYDEPVALACVHTMTSLTGSALTAYALAEGEISLDAAWKAAHVDEDHNIAQWGEDHEAATRRKQRFAEMKAAADLLAALS
ncbi:ATP12 family chaperone protein [Salaquimonas pukyongi]|uniref:ATP12 family chaperone protein n=1 Tax=Salaquimonas pukyongi TaxID=2712698 RepID=UPI00096B8BC6|nr:ATP12 family protein [Salaquimonas pukyongi]